MEAFQVIDAILDVLDATGMVVGLMTLWYTWVVPPRTAPETVTVDVEHFLRAVRTAAPAPSGQPQQEAGGARGNSGWATGTAVDRT